MSSLWLILFIMYNSDFFANHQDHYSQSTPFDFPFQYPPLFQPDENPQIYLDRSEYNDYPEFPDLSKLNPYETPPKIISIENSHIEIMDVKINNNYRNVLLRNRFLLIVNFSKLHMSH